MARIVRFPAVTSQKSCLFSVNDLLSYRQANSRWCGTVSRTQRSAKINRTAILGGQKHEKGNLSRCCRRHGRHSAGCTAASSAAASSEAASTADSTTAESTAASEAAPSEAHEINTTDPIELTISWWGGDSRHEAYQKALEAFHEKYPNITVSPTYGAWSGWEEKQSTALAADQGSDVMQVNWNWLYQYSPTGEKFVDLREYSDIIDLSQWSDTAKNACIVADSLQAVPISMTGRIFYWNMNTFKQAGIEAVPTSYDDLIAAGKAFQEKLGDDYYPLAIGQYDRMILMTFYLESKYGKAWVENNECQYTEEEVVDGLNFIDSLEDNHVIPTRPTMIAAGFDSIDKSQEWIDGKYAGIFEWDSAPSKYQSALADNSGFTVGEEIKFGDKANGGFSKVSMGMAITKSCQHPVEAAALIDFLWNGEGAAIMGSECGIPASTAGLAAAQAADAVKPLVLEANTKVLAFVDMPLDPYYESSKLKDTTDGIYTDVFDGLSYDEYDPQEAAEILLDGVSGVLSANA